MVVLLDSVTPLNGSETCDSCTVDARTKFEPVCPGSENCDDVGDDRLLLRKRLAALDAEMLGAVDLPFISHPVAAGLDARFS